MRARAVVLVAAAGLAAFGVIRGTWAVGGSDSSCYALMAKAFAAGALQPATPLALDAPWPNAATSFAPGGFVPSPQRADAASPICSPGFALFLAPFYLAGGRDAIFLLTPIAGALLVWCTFVFGRTLMTPGLAAAAAASVAAMPVLLFQVVQPMNDVLTATLMMAAMSLAVTVSSSTRPVSASRLLVIGVVCGWLLLVRPNLLLVAVVLAIWAARQGGARGASAFAAGLAPSVAIVAALNTVLYGEALQSGYGAAADLFAVQHIVPNLRHYGQALWATQFGLPLLGLAALAIAPRGARGQVHLTLAVAAAVAAIYLVYRPFPEWWYLRFLLPILPLLLVLAVAVIAWATRREWLAAAVAAASVVFALTTPAAREAASLQRLEGRFRRAGEVMAARLPAGAVVISVWESGSARYHADRPAVLWDALDPASLDVVVAWLSARQRPPFLVLEDWEEPAFRGRFAAHSPLGQLDWPPRFVIDRRVRIYDPRDRDAFYAGAHIASEQIVAPVSPRPR